MIVHRIDVMDARIRHDPDGLHLENSKLNSDWTILEKFKLNFDFDHLRNRYGSSEFQF